MDKLEYKINYERHLPHVQPPGAMLFLTYRLVDSIPIQISDELFAEAHRVERAVRDIQNEHVRAERTYEAQRLLFGKWDAARDAVTAGPRWLDDPRIAQEVADSLRFLDNQVFDLDCYCIMSNHVHVVFTPLPIDENNEQYHSLSAIMHSHKRHTARQANLILKRTGQFWQHESYDHVVRDEAELVRIRDYVLNNPVKAGLVEKRDFWPWSYCKWF